MEIKDEQYIVIQDANIIIDLQNAGLLELWFHLNITTITSDLVVSELKAGKQWPKISRFITPTRINVIHFKADEISQIVTLSSTHAVSIPDGSVLHLSKLKSARLLTGDRKLRKAAQSCAIPCHGILWVLDLLMSHQVLSPKAAIKGLNTMVDLGARLPEKEILSRLKLWGLL